jgi:site-specific recombinase XerD
VKRYRAASKADETKRAFEKNWRAFEQWCADNGFHSIPCPPATLETYLVHLAEEGLKAASIDQARWAINFRHKLAELPAPGDSERVKVVVAGIKRTIGIRQSQKAALTIEHLRQVPFREDLIGKRDKALLLVGFAAGLRRSELAALDVEDIEATQDGYRLLVRASKADQEKGGETTDIVRSVKPDCCPVAALRDWLHAAGIASGAVFRSVNRWGQVRGRISTVSIANLVKRAAGACGMDPAQFGAHSLRAGCATFLLEQGVPLNIVAKQGRWKKQDAVLRYDRNTTSKALRGVY